MTSALQMAKPLGPMQEWKAIFPEFTTLTGSSQFIKKLMAVSLSALTYIRGIFPEKAYGERKLSGIKLKLLTENSGIEGVNKFINLIRSCYDAVDKKYLHSLSIGICMDPEDRDNVIESYNMSFKFSDDEFFIENNSSSVKLSERDPTIEATFLLLKSILTLTELLGPLPNKAFLTMKLLFNEITPQDYEPPGFEPSDVTKFNFPESAIKLELGKVSTDMHGYKMYLKTSLSKASMRQMLEESVLTDSQKTAEKDNIPADYGMPHEGTHESAEDIIENSQKNAESIRCETECPCTCKQDTGIDVLTCTSCGRKQHSICYGILELDDMKTQFYCIRCINEVPFRNSQEDLIYRYEGREQQELCAFRRALVACEPLKQVTLPQLEKKLKCSKQLAKDLTERLVSEGFIKKTVTKNKYMVNENKFKDGYQEYFFRGENKENTENVQKSKFFKGKALNAMDDCTDNTNRNSDLARNDKILSENQFMDYDIDREVEKLNLKGPFEKLPRKNLRRKRSAQDLVEDDPGEDHQPNKKCCTSTKNFIICSYLDPDSNIYS